MPENPADVTSLLVAYGEGDRAAFDRLVPLVYDDLRRIARGQLRRGGPDETLDTTGLVHEAYLKLVDQTRADWQDRAPLPGRGGPRDAPGRGRLRAAARRGQARRRQRMQTS